MSPREYLPDLRHVLRRLGRNKRVRVEQGSKHRLVFVDDELVTVLPKGRGPSCNPNTLKASLHELSKHGVDAW